MATLEQFGVLIQLMHQSYRLARNVRANAVAYDTRAQIGGIDHIALGVEMKGDAQLFLNRLDQVTQAVQRNSTLVSNALGIIGVTLGQANTLKTTLTTAANHVLSATLTNESEITAEAAWLLANTPDYDGLFW